MVDPVKALRTQLANIEIRTGRTLPELSTILAGSGFSRHGELRDYLKRELGMGHGDANTLVHHHLGASSSSAVVAAPVVSMEGHVVLDAIYSGPKAALRSIHDGLMQAIHPFGVFEVAAKKGYVSLRRKKQFAMIGPATKTAVEVGFNMKGVAATDRLIEQAAGGMCNYRLRLSGVDEIDAELVGWIRHAYDQAG